MNIRQFVVGPLATNCYLLSAGEEAAVVDPGALSPELAEAIRSINICYILLTHGHFDHADAAELVQGKTNAAILYHPDEVATFWTSGRQPPPLGKPLQDGDRLILGDEELLVWHLPGHTPGSVAYIWERGKIILCGDVLFAGSVGRTDLPGGSWAALAHSLGRLLSLDGMYRVLPGHGPGTDLEREREENPYLRGLGDGAARG